MAKRSIHTTFFCSSQNIVFVQCSALSYPYISLLLLCVFLLSLFLVMCSFPISDFNLRVPGESWKIQIKDHSFSFSHEKIVRHIKVFLTMLHSFVQSEFWEHILFSLYFHKIYLIYSILRLPLMWSVNGAQYKNISFLFIFLKKIHDKMFPFLRCVLKNHHIALCGSKTLLKGFVELNPN